MYYILNISLNKMFQLFNVLWRILNGYFIYVFIYFLSLINTLLRMNYWNCHVKDVCFHNKSLLFPAHDELTHIWNGIFIWFFLNNKMLSSNILKTSLNLMILKILKLIYHFNIFYTIWWYAFCDRILFLIYLKYFAENA